MNWRDLPPLAGLKAFAAYVETGGIAQAGAALGVSHAAISQQLRSLETHLGVPLLDRSGRAMVLTEDGTLMAEAVTQGFAQIIDATRTVTGANDARPLHISVTPSFAANWLMPRLQAFRDTQPGLSLLVDPSAELITLEQGGVDVAIRFGTGPWAGCDNHLWLRSPMVVVAAPALLEGRKITRPEDLQAMPWLEEFGRSEGTTWLQRHGVAQGITGAFVQVPGNLLLDGARDGQGVAVTVRAFVERDIEAGRLVQLFEDTRAGAGYHIVTRTGVHRPPLKAFVQWLKRQI